MNVFRVKKKFSTLIKGALCSFQEEIQTQHFNFYKINEAVIQTQKYYIFFHNWINKLFSEENKVHRTLLHLAVPATFLASN